MKNKILKLIETSKNSYELADRICELMEKERKQIIKDCLRLSHEAVEDCMKRRRRAF